MSSHTAPRFNVGDVVYTPERHEPFFYDGVIVQPAVFGVIIDEPPTGTNVNDSDTIGWSRVWEGVEKPSEEAVIDIPGSGSVWFLPDHERKYFVKWINKEVHPLGVPHKKFQPMTDGFCLGDGMAVCNISLHFEQELHKAPNFVEILRNRVKQTKQRNAELVISNTLGMDENTTNGISTMVSAYC